MHLSVCDKWVRHHGMARPQVTDGGTASNVDMDGSCEYFEYVVADYRQGVVLQFGVCARY